MAVFQHLCGCWIDDVKRHQQVWGYVLAVVRRSREPDKHSVSRRETGERDCRKGVGRWRRHIGRPPYRRIGRMCTQRASTGSGSGGSGGGGRGRSGGRSRIGSRITPESIQATAGARRWGLSQCRNPSRSLRRRPTGRGWERGRICRVRCEGRCGLQGLLHSGNRGGVEQAGSLGRKSPKISSADKAPHEQCQNAALGEEILHRNYGISGGRVALVGTPARGLGTAGGLPYACR